MSNHEEHIHIHEEHEEETPQSSNIFVRIAVIVGIILILLFIALSIVRFVPKLISSIGTANVSFSSLFSPKDKISVSTNVEKISSGNPFNISWTNNNADKEGVLMFSFKCVDGVTMEYNSISGQRPVLCETNFPLPSKSNTYSFLATSKNVKPVTVSMTVTQWDSEIKTSKASGSASIQVIPEGYVENSDTSATNNTDYEPSTDTNSNNNNNDTTNNSRNTSSNNTRVVDYPSTRTNYTNTRTTNSTVNNGTADLRVTLVKVGRTMSDGSYQSTSAFAEDDRVTVMFNVANVGTARSGNWSLRADLPTKTNSDKVYISGSQPSIAPGDSYEMTISFDTFDPNGRNIIITLNAGDNNQSNNVLNIPVSFNGDHNSNTINNNYSSTGSRADLVTTITGVGIMGSNNQFYTSNKLYSGDKVAIRFEIQNLGDTASGSYRFTADLPTEDGDTFTSNMQPSLAPGETKEFIIGYDNPQTGTNTVTIKADSDNDIRENGESNNTDTENVRVSN